MKYLNDQLLLNRYKIISLLGEGGMGTTYLVYDEAKKERVALKILKLGDDASISTFKSEFEVLSKFRHPNLVSVYEFGTMGENIPYYTMEYIEGQNIKDFFESKNEIDTNTLYRLTVQLLFALDYIHTRKIIHGDIKPENIFVSQKSGEKAIAKLLDFGLSHNLINNKGEPVEKGKGFTGTLQYISPEKIKKENVDGRSDLYSLGIVLYELLTGEIPFKETEILKLFRRHLYEVINSIDSKYSVAEDYKKIIYRLVRKEPFDRYQTAFSAAKDTALLYGETLSDNEASNTEVYFSSGPFTGREEELKTLTEFIHCNDKTTTIISADFGIGKTRLIKELNIVAQLEGYQFITISIIEKSLKAFAPVFNLLNTVKRLAAPKLIEKHKNFFNKINYDTNDTKILITDEVSFIFEIIDFLIEASKEKIIIAFDDLHNADIETLNFLEYFIRNIESQNNSNIKLILSVQEEVSANITKFLKELENNQTLFFVKLNGIDKQTIGKYISSVFKLEQNPEELAEKIYNETSGNFLFIEEIIKILLNEEYIFRKEGKFEIKTNTDLPKLPESIIDAFTLRFNKYSNEEKVFLKNLSVVIGNFNINLVHTVYNLPFSDINNYLKKFIKEEILFFDGKEYGFKSEQIKKILYDDISKESKKELHGLLANYYKKLSTTYTVDLLARHLFYAERYGEAITLLIKSGDIAREIYANADAEDFYKKALFSMEKIGEKFSMIKYSIYSKLFDIYDITGNTDDRAMVLFNMLKIAEKFLDNHKIAEVYVSQSKLNSSIGEFTKAKTIAEKAIILNDRINNQKGKATALVAAGSALFKMGEIKEFVKKYEEAIQIFEEEENCEIEYGLALVDLGIAYWSNLETPEKALEYYDKALSIFKEVSFKKGIIRAMGNSALAYETLGDNKKFLECLYEVKKICEDIGDIKGICTACVNIGIALISLGKYREALEYLDEGLKIAQIIDDKLNLSSLYNSYGIIYSSIGLYDKSFLYYNKALNFNLTTDNKNTIILFYSNLALCMKNMGNPLESAKQLENAEKYLNENTDLHTRVFFLIPKCLLLLDNQEQKDMQLFNETRTTIENLIELSQKSSNLDCELYGYSLLGILYKKNGNTQKALEESQKPIRKINELKYKPIDYSEILWNHYQILKDKGERNLAVETLKRVYEHIINLSKNISDLAMRESFLEKAIPNHFIVDEYKKVVDSSDNENSDVKIKMNNLQALYKITQEIVSILDLDELLAVVIDLALETLKGERGMIFLLEDGELKLKAARNVEKESIKDATEISLSLLNDVASGGKPILTADATSDGRLMQRNSIMNFNIKSLVCVPIKLKEKILGTVYVDGSGSAESIVLFTNIDLEFLEAFASIVAISIENARLLTELKDENIYLRNEVEEKYRFDNIIGNSEALQKVYKVMEGAIKSEGTVMIQGESGTGKELIAKAIHFNSARKKERFIAVDCASLHETLLDSELFGHKKGSFTGAIQDKKGLFEEADQGTIFLDEIINTTLSFQAKLLRVLQEGEIRRVGETENKFINVRVIAAANKNIEEEVRQGRFREDLYYRLNVIPINIPPLRERREDIPILINHFIKKYMDKTSKVINSVSQDLVDSFTAYDWPGNIRELENIINRMIIFAEEDKLTFKDIPADFKKNIVKSDPLDEIFKNNAEISNIKELEKEHILRTLQKTKGNKSEAAKLLGLKRTTLVERMKKYGLMGK